MDCVEIERMLRVEIALMATPIEDVMKWLVGLFPNQPGDVLRTYQVIHSGVFGRMEVVDRAEKAYPCGVKTLHVCQVRLEPIIRAPKQKRTTLTFASGCATTYGTSEYDKEYDRLNGERDFFAGFIGYLEDRTKVETGERYNPTSHDKCFADVYAGWRMAHESAIWLFGGIEDNAPDGARANTTSS